MTATKTTNQKTATEIASMSNLELIQLFGDARRKLADKVAAQEVYVAKRETSFAKHSRRCAFQNDRVAAIIAAQIRNLEATIELCRTEAQTRKADGRYMAVAA